MADSAFLCHRLAIQKGLCKGRIPDASCGGIDHAQNFRLLHHVQRLPLNLHDAAAREWRFRATVSLGITYVRGYILDSVSGYGEGVEPEQGPAAVYGLYSLSSVAPVNLGGGQKFDVMFLGIAKFFLRR